MFKKDESWKKYSDIIDLPHHVSAKHPHMSPEDRAAQFSPFAALTGHEAAIKETARITDEFVEPDADKKQELDEELQMIRMALADNKTAKVQMIFFKPDGKKSGGSYETMMEAAESLTVIVENKKSMRALNKQLKDLDDELAKLPMKQNVSENPETAIDSNGRSETEVSSSSAREKEDTDLRRTARNSNSSVRSSR